MKMLTKIDLHVYVILFTIALTGLYIWKLETGALLI